MEPSLEQLISGIRELRNTMPTFDPHEEGSKEKIENAHYAIHSLVRQVKELVGFESYEQALKFVDQEIENLSRAELAS